MNLVGGGVHRGHASSSVWRNSCLLVCVLAVLQLNNFADEHSLRVSGVGTYRQSPSENLFNHLPQKSVLNEAESAMSAPPRTFPGVN